MIIARKAGVCIAGSSGRHFGCFGSGVILYDVFVEGSDTPRTREQIADLYHAGRIKRNDPCKLAAEREWRTVDEYFPMLKHAGPRMSIADEGRERLVPWVAAGVVALSVLIVMAVFAAAVVRSRGPEIAAAPSGNFSRVTESYGAVPHYAIQPNSTTTLPGVSSGGPPGAALVGAPAATSPPHDESAQRKQALWEGQRLAREQLQRDQAVLAERLRSENARKEAERQRAAGWDTILPLDADRMIEVAGASVRIRVHDNDVTSIDYWINGAWHRDVKKEKGITGSGADETYLYGSGQASLYYVWELSGALNHCRLRVRQR